MRPPELPRELGESAFGSRPRPASDPLPVDDGRGVRPGSRSVVHVERSRGRRVVPSFHGESEAGCEFPRRPPVLSDRPRAGCVALLPDRESLGVQRHQRQNQVIITNCLLQ